MKNKKARLDGKRIMIAEDNALNAREIRSFLLEFGSIPIGPVASPRQALDAIENENLDLALLDVHLAGGEVDPVARRLLELGIPIVYLTGDPASIEDRGLPPATVLPKPFDEIELLDSLLQATDLLEAN